MPLSYSIILKSGFGSIIGYFTGAFFKQVSQKLIYYTGLGLSFISWLTYVKYITINWKQIDADIFHFVAKRRLEGEGSMKRYAKKFFSHIVPLGAGFVYWFKYAFENS